MSYSNTKGAWQDSDGLWRTSSGYVYSGQGATGSQLTPQSNPNPPADYQAWKDETAASNRAWNADRHAILAAGGDDIGPNPNAVSYQNYGTGSYSGTGMTGAQAQAQAAQEAAAAENRKRVEAAIAAVEAQRAGLQGQADTAKREAYQNYMLNSNKAPEQLAASGLTGGIAESTAADLYKSYENSRAGVDSSLMEANRQVDTDINTIRAQGDATAAGIDAQYSKWLADSIMQQMMQQNQLSQQSEQFWASQALSREQMELQERMAAAARAASANTANTTAVNKQQAEQEDMYMSILSALRSDPDPIGLYNTYGRYWEQKLSPEQLNHVMQAAGVRSQHRSGR